jgi:hypothetical protein
MKYLRLFGLGGLLIGLALASVNCSATGTPITTEADFAGFTTDIQLSQSTGVAGLLSVESHADKIVTKYTVTIEDDTLIFRQDGNNLRKADFDAFETRQNVEIWFTGPVLESWPMQATAKQVIILE